MRQSLLIGAVAAITALSLSSPALAADAKMSKMNIPCAQGAVDTRETAVGSALTTFTTSLQSAFSQRRTALHNAWAISDAVQRKAAIRAAWDGFKASKKAAMEQWKIARKDAWKTFLTAAKACKIDSKSEEGGNKIEAE